MTIAGLPQIQRDTQLTYAIEWISTQGCITDPTLAEIEGETTFIQWLYGLDDEQFSTLNDLPYLQTALKTAAFERKMRKIILDNLGSGKDITMKVRGRAPVILSKHDVWIGRIVEATKNLHMPSAQLLYARELASRIEDPEEQDKIRFEVTRFLGLWGALEEAREVAKGIKSKGYRQDAKEQLCIAKLEAELRLR